ncbi:carbon-nitrogen hydrolase family protein [Vibrio plantisponsor]|uniref:Carbon-nitrogen hydrolase family protein n=1 Tax=Vibrio plantisponsor TaxID=664643 RepID=A0ABU4II31_9VIBR|nr:carbon-nitrogen hydrolase family protein [Vibrio plantisponsor]MDW6018156.1 carbon-nitrogen hydrolase family protein [Vibrio plantisponsor]NNM39437.1 carbon-nitrogen hydrolase family protein [Vibrio plantisponsor]
MERIGLIQMTSSSDVNENLTYIEQQTTLLAKQGAKWVVTPENAVVFGNKENYHNSAEELGDGPVQERISRLATEQQVWILIGSMPIRRTSAENQGVTTTSVLFNPQGQIVAHYDKLHMFDVDVADGHKRYRESETFTPGNDIVVAETPFAKLGLSICYDVRFPNLYAELRRLGAQILLVPAAFTAVTGKAHWEVLLRARAIESQCWVIAVGQGGHHACGRETWGHSMVISPWGEIIASLDQDAASLVVDIELEQIESVRAAMPISAHTRFRNQFILS